MSTRKILGPIRADEALQLEAGYIASIGFNEGMIIVNRTAQDILDLIQKHPSIRIIPEFPLNTKPPFGHPGWSSWLDALDHDLADYQQWALKR